MMLFDWGCARADQDQDCALRRLDYARAGRHLWDMSAEPCLVRPAAVAGQFYPGTRDALSRSVAELLDEAPAAGPRPKALVVPHAGYVYSGPTAAAAYGLLHGLAGAIRRVVLLGPSHHVPLRGMAVPATAAFETPMGRVPLDRAGADRLVASGLARCWDAPHELEHALEVQLPFLQAQLGDFELLPVAVGAAPADAVADLLEAVWGGAETLVVISTDLSHFHSYAEARAIDRETCTAILARDPRLSGERACGCYALNGLLQAARRRDLVPRLLDMRNSGDTAGPRDRVVGYASFAIDAC
jgi:AmmeMemoRadiSam system protein B